MKISNIENRGNFGARGVYFSILKNFLAHFAKCFTETEIPYKKQSELHNLTTPPSTTGS
jgi:hypothetical protein